MGGLAVGGYRFNSERHPKRVYLCHPQNSKHQKSEATAT